jgi:hypothetical protein
MGMADDDLAYVRENTELLTEQQSKYFYQAGLSNGAEMVNSLTRRTLDHLQAQTEYLIQLAKSEAPENSYLLSNRFFALAFGGIKEHYDQIGAIITYAPSSNRNSLIELEVVEKWAWGFNNFVRYLIQLPEIYAKVFSCAHYVPVKALEWVQMRHFDKSPLNEQQQFLADLMRDSQQIKALARSFRDQLECVCDSCSACCGDSCQCNYVHYDLDDLDDPCDDPAECSYPSHAYCDTCAECECC